MFFAFNFCIMMIFVLFMLFISSGDFYDDYSQFAWIMLAPVIIYTLSITSEIVLYPLFAATGTIELINGENPLSTRNIVSNNATGYLIAVLIYEYNVFCAFIYNKEILEN